MPYMSKSGRKRKRAVSLSQRAQNIGLAVLAVLVLGAIAWAFMPRNAPVADAGPSAGIKTQAPAEVEPVAAFIGDSYTQGARASGPDKRWSTIVAGEMGWTEENFGIGGTGYLAATSDDGSGKARPTYAERLDDVAAAKPDIVVVSGGRNDTGKPAAEVEEAIAGFFPALREAVPDAKIYVVSPWWDATDAPASLARVAEKVEAEASAAGATYVETGQPLAGEPDLISDDGVHPTDEGYAALAKTFLAAIN